MADTKEEVLELGQARLVATTIRFSLGLVWDYGARPPETKAVTGHRTPKGSSGLTEEQACFRGNDSMESFSTKERRERAIKAATNIAAAYHIKSGAPAILKDSNNTVIHLAPAPVVAKVATSIFRKQDVSNLKHELDIALHLADVGAPIVPPSAEVPPAVYRHGDVELTFWQYCPGEVREEIDRPELVAAVKEFHAALSGYRGALGSFTEDYEKCYSLLDGDGLSPELSGTDRQFLREVYEYLSPRLQTFDYESVPAHTEMHGRNVMWMGKKPLLIDFESCCLAP